VEAILAEAVFQQGRDDEADLLTRESERSDGAGIVAPAVGAR